jgi:cytochrome c oxidase assembly factor CtaG
MNAAWAHGAEAAQSGSFGWSFEPWVVIPVLLVACLYANGSSRLRARGKQTRRAEDALFWAGLALAAVALISPVHEIGTQIFTVHMIEHELLMVGAAPLLVAARPAAALLWGIPDKLRTGASVLLHARSMRAVWRNVSELWSATAIHTLILWAWHVPSLFHWVLDNEGMHALQHISFLGSALIFWSAVFQYERARHEGQAIVALFLTSLQAGALGALLTFSKVIWYPFAIDPFPICGLTRFEDQSLAGLIMWIPACSIYVIAALIFMARWLSHMETRHA